LKKLFFALVFGALIIGCSQKNYFQPKKISRNLSYKLDLKTAIREVTREGLTYNNGRVVTDKRGMLNYKIEKGYHLVYDALNAILVADKSGNIKVIQDGKVKFKHTFETVLASGSLHRRYGAFVLANNRVILYDFNLDKILFEEALEPEFAMDNRIANPIFVQNLVIFPTLDGRLLVVDIQTKKIVKDIALSNRDLFNNIIFLQEKNGNIVAATRYKVVSISKTSKFEKRFDIKDILYDGNYIYIFTNGGDVLKLNLSLKLIAKKSFANATFVAVSYYNNKIYAVEKNGYLISMDKSLNSAEVLKLPESISKAIFAYKNKFFIDRYFLKVQ
jgi:hypothetical protein